MARTSKLVRAAQWWKHLRKYKRTFWKRERKAYKKEVKSEQDDSR